MSTPNEIQLQWHTVKADAERRLMELRERNDSPDLSFEQTQVLRGQIMEIKHLLNMPTALAMQRQVSQNLPESD